MIAKVKEINFLPERIVQARKKRKRTFLVAVLSFLLIGAFLAPYGYLYWQLNENRKQLVSLEDEYKKVKLTADEVNAMISERTTLEEETHQVRDVINARRTWPGMLRDIETIVPEEVWFITLELTNDSDISTKGEVAPVIFQSTNAGQEKSAPSQPSQAAPENAQKKEAKEEDKSNKAPKGPINLALIKGKSKSLEHIGRFIYKLNELPYFYEVKLLEIKRNGEDEIVTEELNFIIMAPLKEGAGRAR